MTPRRRCPTCGSKQWHKEPSSGLIACSEGHVLPGYRNETLEMEEIGPHAVKKRALKREKKEKAESTADPKLYYGVKGRYHYFLCQQLILRKQVETLISLWRLPQEFEIVSRDLWALHLSLLPSPPPAVELQSHAQEQDAVGRDEIDVKENASYPTPGASSRGNTADKDGSVESFSTDDSDSELERLMRENSEDSSSDDESNDSDPKHIARKKGKRKGRYAYESPASTIGVLVVACWTLRIPVLYRDFTRAIEAYRLPYLDPVRLLPQSLVIHLTKHSIQALSPPHAPSTLLMHGLASRLAKKLHISYGVFTSAASAPPILWRVIKAMGGTPTLYWLTKRLSQILSLPLTLHSSLAPGLQRINKLDPERHKYDNVPPEVGLLSACIIALKMVYGLDGRLRNRLPTETGDPACCLPKVEDYLELLKALDEADARGQRDVFSSQDPMAIGELSDEKIDEYLDFCQRALLGPRIDKADDTLNNYFPSNTDGSMGAEKPNEREYEDRVSRRLGGVSLNEDENAEILRPGEGYTIWSSRDVVGEMPREYHGVIVRGSRVVGVGEEYVNGVVEMYERRLKRWWERRQ